MHASLSRRAYQRGSPILVLLLLAGCDAAERGCASCDAGMDRADAAVAADGAAPADGAAADRDGGPNDAAAVSDGGFDAGTDAGPESPRGCRIGGAALGVRWRFRSVSGTTTSESASEITSWTQTGDSVSFTSVGEGSTRGDGFDQTFTSTSRMRCDDSGTYLLSSETSGATRRDGMSTPFSSRTTYSPPFLSMTADVAVGHTWTVRQSGSTVSAGMTTPFDLTWRYRAAREARRTVGAGTFDAIEIEVNEVGGSGSSWSFWFAPGVGTIESGASELVERTP